MLKMNRNFSGWLEEMHLRRIEMICLKQDVARNELNLIFSLKFFIKTIKFENFRTRLGLSTKLPIK